jgi:hypothetical protein
MIQAAGADVAPAFGLPDPGADDHGHRSDTGNFLGVAIYVVGNEVVLVSEMQAGWYRYVSQWRLAADGTIKPRFGFACGGEPVSLQRSPPSRLLAPRLRPSNGGKQSRARIQ